MIDWIKAVRDKRIENKLQQLGFKQTFSDIYCVKYERRNLLYDFTQVVIIGKKKDGNHLIHSLTEEDSSPVGLTGVETKWFLKKMKSLGWYSKMPSNFNIQ